jgi:hypothetical protein
MLLHVKKFCGTEGYRMVEYGARSMSLRGTGDMHYSHARDVIGYKNVGFEPLRSGLPSITLV